MLTRLQNTSRSEHVIERTFNKLHDRGEGVLIAYMTGLYPSPAVFQANCEAMVQGGADILEVGIPFSDPIADGPVIQASNARSLSQGATPSSVLDEIDKLSSHIPVPIVVLTYYNPVLSMGEESFLERASNAGVNGVVIPDLPMEEGKVFGELASKHSIDRILLAAPNTSNARLRKILDLSRGFLYLVSLYGVTGPRDALSSQALMTVKRVKKLSDGKMPISAGFGISSPEQISSLISSGADGAIVGSSLVSIVDRRLDQPDTAGGYLKKAVAELKQATRKK